MPLDKIGPSPRIAVWREGAGEALFFLHGIGGNRENWRDQITHFAPHFQVFAWDARGYGDSDDYEGPLSISDFADDLRRVLDHYRIEKAHVAGLSLGGRAAQRFYFRHPDRVRTLALIDTRPDTGDSRTPEQREAFFRERAKPLLEGKTPAEIAPNIARTLIGAKSPQRTFDLLIESMKKLRRDSYIKAVRANLADDYVGDPTTIRVPTLVLVGADDTLTPPALSRQLNAAIAGSEYREIPEAGHLSNLDCPDQFNAILLDFLQRHAGAKPAASR
jgi:3-oxoadipate enol-lactonase